MGRKKHKKFHTVGYGWNKQSKKEGKNMSGYHGCQNGFQGSTKTEITPTMNVLKNEPSSMGVKVSDDKPATTEMQKLKVIISHKVFKELMTFVRLIDDEINGLGMVRREGNNFFIEEIFLLDQEVSGAACDIKPDAMVKLMQSLIEQGKNPSDIRFWWHSHNKMGTFWSGTDATTSRNFAGSEYLVSLVANHAGDVKAKINFYTPIDFAVDNVEVLVVQLDHDETLLDRCKLAITEKVKKTTYVYQGFNNVQSSPSVVHPRGVLPSRKVAELGGETVSAAALPDRIIPGNGQESIKIDTARRESILLELKEGPFGGRVVIDKMVLVWNEKLRKYEAEDLFTKKPMTDKEMQDRLGYDYNMNARDYLNAQEKLLNPSERDYDQEKDVYNHFGRC